MLGFIQVSDPMMILGSADSKRLKISAFLFLQLWKLIASVLTLRNDEVDFFLM